MQSFTKQNLSDEIVAKLALKAGFSNVSGIFPLVSGEFNSAYVFSSLGHEYVLKIAPKREAKVLSYEQNLMEQEVYYYGLIEMQTKVSIPKIYFYNKASRECDYNFFIMEKLSSKPLSDILLKKEEKKLVREKLGRLLAELHTIKGEKFGYIQNCLYENWYEAVKAMTANLINDCKSMKKKAKSGLRLLSYIEKFKQILLDVESTYTHFDIWEGNVFYEKNDEVKLTLIDTERSFWGDRLGDFVSIEILKKLQEKTSIIKGYNSAAKQPLTLSSQEKIRFNILLAYLGLIVYTEKFARYKKTQLKFIINIILAKKLFKSAFRQLKIYSKEENLKVEISRL